MKKLKSFKLFNEALDDSTDNLFADETLDQKIPSDDETYLEDGVEVDEVDQLDDFDAEDGFEVDNIDNDDESIEKSPLSFEEAKRWVIENYDDELVSNLVDDEILTIVDEEPHRSRMEQEEYADASDYYLDYGQGEAQTNVARDIVDAMRSKYDFTFDEEDEETNLYEFLRNIFDSLQY